MRGATLAAFVCALAALPLGGSVGLAQQPAQVPLQPSQHQSVDQAPPSPAQQTIAEVTGFRSARFGMTEQQVREAIKADFGIEAKDVREGANNLEKTKFLAIMVENLVPGAGHALVTYIFGYTGHKLIQVNVIWGKQAGQDATPAELTATGRILQQYFVGQGFDAKTQIVNRQLNTGAIVLFNGYDDKKRSVLLLLDLSAVPKNPPVEPKPAPAKPGAVKPPPAKAPPAKATEVELIATSLRLAYMENAINPDIFRIPKGKF